MTNGRPAACLFHTKIWNSTSATALTFLVGKNSAFGIPMPCLQNCSKKCCLNKCFKCLNFRAKNDPYRTCRKHQFYETIEDSQSAAFGKYCEASGGKLATLADPPRHSLRSLPPSPTALGIKTHIPSVRSRPRWPRRSKRPAPHGPLAFDAHLNVSCKTSQTFRKTSASLASEATEAGLISPMTWRWVEAACKVSTS